MHLKIITSRSRAKIVGKRIKYDAGISSNLPSTPDTAAFQHPDDDDFESPVAPTKSCNQESTQMTCSQTKKVENLVNNIKLRTKKYDRLEKAKEKLKLVDENDDVSPAVKQKKRKVDDDAEVSFYAISKEQGYLLDTNSSKENLS